MAADGPLALPDWRGLPVVATGAGVTGPSVVRALAPLGAEVTVLDDADGSAAAGLPAGTALVVTSPGWRPEHPLLRAAADRGVPIWGDVELAWRLSAASGAGAPWLVVTGTNGKTSTTAMLAEILAAGGLSAPACGNFGPPLLDAVLHEPPHDALAVELSSFQLHWAPSVRPLAAAVLNIADDHLDWHGSRAAYEQAKARAYGDEGTVAVGVVGDEGSERLLARAPGRQVRVRLGPPGPGELGVVRELGGPTLLVDRCFAPGAPDAADALAVLEDLPALRAPHDVTNALAAAALARALGVTAEAVAEGLASYAPGPHRVQVVLCGAGAGGVTWVDDSKATNPHAAIASLAAYDDGDGPRVVWVAGGLDKGLSFDALAQEARGRVRAAVLLGRCAPQLAEALARHAPEIPVIRVADLDAGAREAARLARAGDTVLLAPAAASMDMFRDYRERGEVFAAAARRHGSSGGTATP